MIQNARKFETDIYNHDINKRKIRIAICDHKNKSRLWIWESLLII